MAPDEGILRIKWVPVTLEAFADIFGMHASDLVRTNSDPEDLTYRFRGSVFPLLRWLEVLGSPRAYVAVVTTDEKWEIERFNLPDPE